MRLLDIMKIARVIFTEDLLGADGTGSASCISSCSVVPISMNYIKRFIHEYLFQRMILHNSVSIAYLCKRVTVYGCGLRIQFCGFIFSSKHDLQSDKLQINIYERRTS